MTNNNTPHNHDEVVVEMTSTSTTQQFSLNSPPSTHPSSPEPTIDSQARNKQRDSTQKSAKSLPSSLKTPRTSSVTGFHSRNFRIHTCCGILELNCLKLTSLTALLVSLVAFTFLIVIISVNYSIVSYDSNILAQINNDGSFYRELMKLSCRAAVTSEYNRTLSMEYVNSYNNYYTLYYIDLNRTTANIPDSIIAFNQLNVSRENTKSRRAVKTELSMIGQIASGNYTQALITLDSEEYRTLLTGYEQEVQPIFDYVANLKKHSADLDLATTTAALTITCVSIVIVVPVLIIFIILSVKKDNSKEKQLRLVKKYLIMDTINDADVAERFKEFCKQERSEENFALLEKINEYKRLCEKSFDIQVYLFDTDLSSSDQSEVTNSSNDDSSKKKNKSKKGFTEKDLLEIEKKKFEIAFEIYTDFLDVRGDRSVNISKQLADHVKQQLDFFAKGDNESMPENVFESIEYEMCVLMMDTHHRFKQALEIQIKQKKKIISSKKFKK